MYKKCFKNLLRGDWLHWTTTDSSGDSKFWLKVWNQSTETVQEHTKHNNETNSRAVTQWIERLTDNIQLVGSHTSTDICRGVGGSLEGQLQRYIDHRIFNKQQMLIKTGYAVLSNGIQKMTTNQMARCIQVVIISDANYADDMSYWLWALCYTTSLLCMTDSSRPIWSTMTTSISLKPSAHVRSHPHI